ncbi:MAG: type IV pilus secretin PilQ [Bdellovibrionota bacterium]
MTKKLDLKKIWSTFMVAALMAGCAGFDNREQADIEDGDMEFAEEKSADETLNSDTNAPALSAETSLTDIRYVSRRGGGTVVIESTSPVTFRTRENRELNQFIVDLANAKLPDRLRRPYNTKDFGQSIASINAYQDAGSSTARVVIQFRTPTRATITQAGKRLLVFSGGPASTIQGQDRVLDDVQEIDSLAKAASLEGGPADPRILATTSEGSDPTKFYGKPISIEVREMNVRDVINLIAEQSGANIVIASGIEGNLTLKLKQIPWDQALMIVLKTQNLGYVRQGSVLRIAPNSALQVEAETARRIIDAQRAAEPIRVKIIPVGYAKVADLIAQVKPLLTAGRGTVVADVRTSSLIVTDTPEVLERAGNLIKALDTPPLQVMIEGKVVEAKENFRRDYGIKWGYSGSQTSLGGNLALQQNNLRINPSGGDSVPGVINGAFRLGTFDVFGDLDATLGLAESESVAKVISSPRVVVLNNESANIDQTVAIMVQTTSTTNNTTTTTYTPINVSLSLNVTPQITTEGDVLMDVSIQRDFADAGSVSAVPPINKRSAKTKVMVRNGQTAVIGGIYQADHTTTEQGVPWLRNIPVFGWLFKSRTTRNDKNELMLFLTPRIINVDKALPKEGTL